MRWFVLALAAALLLPTVTFAQPTQLTISEVYPNPAPGDREFVEIWNPTSDAVDISAWVVEDEAGNQFAFPEWMVPPGGRVVVWGGGEADGRGPAWTRSTAWNNGGDEVRLLDNQGTLVDRVRYGPGDDSVADAPAAGQSIQWQDGWVLGNPTPGNDADAPAAQASFEVQNVPPRIEILDAPNHAGPGESIRIAFRVEDGNGDALEWAMNGPSAHAGVGAGVHDVTTQAPGAEGVARWTLSVTDGNQSVAEVIAVHVQSSPLFVSVGADGLPFPPLVPGATNVQSTAMFSIENRGNETVTPRIDISPFRGPETVPVDGNVQLLVGNHTVAYGGPLTALPSLAPGETHAISMVLLQVPEPLPAGRYGTTFAVTT